MAIKNTKLGGTDFAEPPAPAYESKGEDFNDTFDAAADLIFANNRLIGVQTSGGTRGNGLAQVGSTLSISAGEVTDKILIMVQSTVINNGASTTGDSSIEIYIGESGSEASKVTYNLIGGSHTNINIDGCQMFYYEPTTDEKNNGFNIQIYADSGDGGRLCGYTQLAVNGN